MRKIKSTALLGAFVAVASVGVISHEAHGTTVGGIAISNVSKEMLPNSVSLSALDVYPSVTLPGASITLTLSGASFVYNNTNASSSSYAIMSGTNSYCTGIASYSGQNSLTLSCGSNTLNEGTTYTLVGGGSSGSFIVANVPQNTSSIVLYYSSNISGDTSSSATLAEVQQQLSVSPSSSTTAVISPTSGGTAFTDNSPSATNAVTILNSQYSGQWTSDTINPPYTINFIFTGIPGSVTSVGATDNGTQTAGPVTPVNQSATVSFTLANSKAPFVSSSSSDTINFSFTNSGNIQPGTIVLSSIAGVISSTSSYTYLSTPQNFINFAYTGVQLYIPDALAPDNNVIKSGYITISMPPSATISSISVLNTGVSCSASSLSLTSTSTTSLSYIDLSQLPSLCPGITPIAWQSGVPLVINISGTNVNTNDITADAYATFNGMLKRIPVVVVSNGTGLSFFSY